MRLHSGLLLPCLALGLIACAKSPPSAKDGLLPMEPATSLIVAASSDAATPAGPLTLEAAIEWALLNNPALRGQYARYEAQLLEEPQATSLADPMAMISQQEAFRGPGDERKNMLTFSQSFPWFGKRGMRGGVARSEALQALEDYRMDALDVRREIIRTWHMLHYEEANRELTAQEHDLLGQILEATSFLYETGRADRGSLLRVQTEMARVESDLPSIDASIEGQRRQLHQLLGLQSTASIDFQTEGSTSFADNPDTPAIVAEAIANRPELEGLRHRQEAARLAGRLARADYYPDFTVGVGLEAMGEGGSSFYTPDSDGRTDSWLASVGINIPIPNARRRAATHQARLIQDEVALLQEATEDNIFAEVYSTVARIEGLRQQHRLYRDTILVLAEEAFDAAETAYRVGRTTYVDLIDVQRTLIAARRDTLRIERDYHLALADLERAIGLPIELVSTSKEDQP